MVTLIGVVRLSVLFTLWAKDVEFEATTAKPRGFAVNADPLATAQAELHEEMGVAGELSLIGTFTSDSGVQETRVTVVLADVPDTAGTIHR